MSAAHTPGPWRVAPGQYGSASLLIVADDPAAGSIDRWTIGQAWERNPYSRDEQRQPSRAVAESNARVMAAALDLLAALQDLVAVIDVPDANCACHVSPPCGDCVEYGGLRAALADAAAAIAKAGA